MGYYAIENAITTEDVEGSIEITEEQYNEVMQQLASGNYLYISIKDGVFSTSPAPNPAPVQSEEDRIANEMITINQIETLWKNGQLKITSRQLEALEEAEADVPPPDLLNGTRQQWLKYRGLLNNWKQGGNPEYPDVSKRPKRPDLN